MGEDWEHLEPWLLRSTNNYNYDFAEIFSPENDSFTSALLASSFDDDIFSLMSSTPATSSSSSGEASKELRRAEGKIKKQKFRAWRKNSKSSFFTIEPENFRELVQEMTGAGIGARSPAPEKRTRKAPPPDCSVPTLDTSAMWLESWRVQL